LTVGRFAIRIARRAKPIPARRSPTMDTPEALREFLMYVVANLIDHPKEASIAVGTNVNGAISYRLQLAPEDVKRVVGKNGFTISAIRSLMNVAARKHNVKISLRVDGVLEEEISDRPHSSETDAPHSEDAQA
jgi:predicted RNA-binding protein YlqC (UPF0109 family)